MDDVVPHRTEIEVRAPMTWRRPPTFPRWAFVMALVLVASACLVTGQLGNLSFRYDNPDSLLGASGVRQPLAVGSSVDLFVYRAGNRIVGRRGGRPGETRTDRSVAITGAHSSAPWVASVEVVDGAAVRITGRAPGQAEVAVRVKEESGEGVVADLIAIEVATVDRVEITHWIHEPRSGGWGMIAESWLGPEAVYLRGGEARFWVHATDANDRTVLGFGPEPPLEMRPGDAAVLRASRDDLQHVALSFEKAGALDLLPKNGTLRRLTVIDPSEIEGISLVGAFSSMGAISTTSDATGGVPTTGSVGSTSMMRSEGARVGEMAPALIQARLARGGHATLLAVKPVLSSSTPGICAPLDPESDASALRIFGDSFVGARLLAEGVCHVEVSVAGHRVGGEIQVRPKR